MPPRVTVFASGSNEAREIRGFGLAGIPVGFAASNIRKQALDELLASNGPIFADSGAFTEVSFASGAPCVVAPISHQEWLDRLAIYHRLAVVHGGNLHAVAPDMVANQQETLLRLGRYRSQIGALHALGAHVLVPVQNGELSAAAFYREAVYVAGIPLVPAIPMKKAATSDADLLQFVREVRPDRLHLLGIGYSRSTAKTLVRRILAIAPELQLSLDSNRLRAVTGEGRVMTSIERRLRGEPVDGIYGVAESEALGVAGECLDYTDSIGCPSCWATIEQLREIAAAAELGASETETFLRDPDSFLQTEVREGGCSYWEVPQIAYALDMAWQCYLTSKHHDSVRTAAIRLVFAEAQIASQAKPVAA